MDVMVCIGELLPPAAQPRYPSGPWYLCSLRSGAVTALFCCYKRHLALLDLDAA